MMKRCVLLLLCICSCLFYSINRSMNVSQSNLFLSRRFLFSVMMAGDGGRSSRRTIRPWKYPYSKNRYTCAFQFSTKRTIFRYYAFTFWFQQRFFHYYGGMALFIIIIIIVSYIARAAKRVVVEKSIHLLQCGSLHVRPRLPLVGPQR